MSVGPVAALFLSPAYLVAVMLHLMVVVCVVTVRLLVALVLKAAEGVAYAVRRFTDWRQKSRNRGD